MLHTHLWSSQKKGPWMFKPLHFDHPPPPPSSGAGFLSFPERVHLFFCGILLNPGLVSMWITTLVIALNKNTLHNQVLQILSVKQRFLFLLIAHVNRGSKNTYRVNNLTPNTVKTTFQDNPLPHV